MEPHTPHGIAAPRDPPPSTRTWSRRSRPAFTGTRLLAFTYRDQLGRSTHRQVEPHGLLVRPPLWYVIAWDPGRNAPRLFRADRIGTPTVSDHTFHPRPTELVTGVCPDANPVGR